MPGWRPSPQRSMVMYIRSHGTPTAAILPYTLHQHKQPPLTLPAAPPVDRSDSALSGWRLPLLLRRQRGPAGWCAVAEQYFSAAPALCPTFLIACYGDAVINAWLRALEVPITATSVRVEHVQMLDREMAAGTCPTSICVCRLSEGGALAIASVLLHPKTLGGCVVSTGSVPLSKSLAERVPPEARKTPVLWFHGMADGVVLFEAGRTGCAFLQELGIAREFKVIQKQMKL